LLEFVKKIKKVTSALLSSPWSSNDELNYFLHLSLCKYQ
jgi:hypothetical protein